MARQPRADDLFRPIGAIQGAYRYLFAGRDSVVRDILGSFELSGAVPIIYGERGVGKTSVAWRAFEVLRDKDTDAAAVDVASEFELDDHYIPLWVECGDWFAGIESALLALLMPKGLRQAVTIVDLFPDLLSEEARIKASTSFELNLAVFKAKADLSRSERKGAIEKAFENYTDRALDNPIEMFSQLCGKLIEKYSSSTVVVFIDEFDRLPDKSMVGSILKTLTGIRFVIIGVATSSDDLIGSHPSVDRKLSKVYVPPFRYEEAAEIFENASQASLEYAGSNGISFTEPFVRQVFEETGGYPNLIQKVGYYAIQPRRLNKTMFDRPVIVDLPDYKPAVRAMFKHGQRSGDSEGEIEFKIASSVGDSTRRMAIIRKLAAYGTGWMNVSDLSAALGRDDRQQLQGNLDRFVDEGVLHRNQETEEVAFSSPVHLMAARLFVEARSN